MPFIEQTFSKKKHSFSASHFLVGYEKCDRLHGHTYHVKVQLQYNQLESASPIDYRIINDVIQQELTLLNQKILIPSESSDIQMISNLNNKNWNIIVKGKKYSFPKQDVQILDSIDQTTSENISYYLHQRFSSWIQKNFPGSISSLKVEISENLGNYSSYSALV